MSIIRNFGLFWERRFVHWGSKGKGNEGKLLGYHGSVSSLVDFREQAGVYVLYEGENIANQRVVYVGQAGIGNANLFGRLKAHQTDHLWNRWSRFSWFGIYDVGKNNTLVHVDPEKTIHSGVDKVLDHVEGVLLTLFEPPLNKQGAQWGDKATEYYQAHNEEDTAIGGKLEEMYRLLKNIESVVDGE